MRQEAMSSTSTPCLASEIVPRTTPHGLGNIGVPLALAATDHAAIRMTMTRYGDPREGLLANMDSRRPVGTNEAVIHVLLVGNAARQDLVVVGELHQLVKFALYEP